MVSESDPVLDELSQRCHKLLDTQLLIVDYALPSPFRQYIVGRVRIFRQEDYMSVFLDHPVYTSTDTMVFAERELKHLFSHWPGIYEVLRILRTEMILDDLSAT